MELTKLLAPKSVAIVGASERSSFGGDCTRNMFRFSSKDVKIYLVNPKQDTIMGHKCYHSLLEIEDTIDLCIICTPKATVIDILRQAAQKGCGGAVVYASGYRETGAQGAAFEKELVDTANELGIAVMGPNCAGYANFVGGIFAFAFLVEERDRRGNIGLLSQSGQIVLSALDYPELAFSYVISSGNSADVKMEDYLDFLVEDEQTKVVAVYLEGITQPDKFANTLAKAARKRKPVVILKTGRSEKSKQLAASHTGSLSGSDKTLRSLFKKYGVIDVSDIQELFSVAEAFSVMNKLPKGNRAVYMNVSGGEAGVTADLNDLYGIPLAEYSLETRAVLKQLVPEYGSVNNPFDMTAGIGYNAPVMSKALQTISADSSVDFIVIGYTMIPEMWDDTSEHMVQAIEMAQAESRNTLKPIFWLSYVEHTRHPETRQRCEQCGVPVLPSGHYGMMVMKKICDFINFHFEDHKLGLPNTSNQAFAVPLSEYDSLCRLKSFGISIPPQRVAATVEEALAAAEELGYPLSCKIHSPDIQHKSDVGGVKLNLQTPEHLEEAFAEIMKNVSANRPDARLEGVLLKPMLKSGVEIIIGVVNDPQFGPNVMVGLGGVFVELFKDVQMALAPISKNQALQMISSLKSYKLLTGYRGSPKVNIDSLAELLVKVGDFALANKDTLKELDINPVFACEDGVSIADALLVEYNTEGVGDEA